MLCVGRVCRVWSLGRAAGGGAVPRLSRAIAAGEIDDEEEEDASAGEEDELVEGRESCMSDGQLEGACGTGTEVNSKKDRKPAAAELI